jgi:hypothetical protein
VFTAYIDESARRRASEGACVYTLAAVVVPDESIEKVQQAMLDLRYRKSPRVHWRDEREERLPEIVRTVAGLPWTGVVTVCLHGPELKSERARRLCIMRLLPELSERGVNRIFFESRQEPRDREDRGLLVGLRKGSLFRSDIEVDWKPALSDSALWAADVVAGALSWWFDDKGDHWRVLEDLVHMIDIDP